ncbi:FeoA family protein [Tropicimonas sp. IMCC34043]|uniref:FeoA family protein n=1 Tax=Tropicimonas sp. IMCC34043 TaxID=2248760 RepID=UPI000E250112|nr:FeoA family protein [Tropicimonas sp. IMCC34043]
MTLKLKDLAVGDRAAVTGYGKGGQAYRQKLLSMGLTPGIEIRVTRVAPLGDPVEIRVRGYALSLRRDEADTLEIRRIDA